MLVLMTVTHLPTVFSARFGQPFGFVSAAEGFVFLSAFLVGSVYGRIARERGAAAMRQALLGRALKVYAVHAALLLFLFFVLVPLAHSRGAHAIIDLASFYLRDPGAALLGGLLLVYNPPLLDILPMYVIFLALSPWVLQFASATAGCRSLRRAPASGCSPSSTAAAPSTTGLPICWVWRGNTSKPARSCCFAWQLLWFAGLCAGERADDRPLQCKPKAAGGARCCGGRSRWPGSCSRGDTSSVRRPSAETRR
jgi:hypothetical protein